MYDIFLPRCKDVRIKRFLKLLFGLVGLMQCYANNIVGLLCRTSLISDITTDWLTWRHGSFIDRVYYTNTVNRDDVTCHFICFCYVVCKIHNKVRSKTDVTCLELQLSLFSLFTNMFYTRMFFFTGIQGF